VIKIHSENENIFFSGGNDKVVLKWTLVPTDIDRIFCYRILTHHTQLTDLIISTDNCYMFILSWSNNFPLCSIDEKTSKD